MITLTSQAMEAIRHSAERCGAEGMFLRITAKTGRGGRIVHGMGFDERRNGDLLIDSDELSIVINSEHKPLLDGAVVDFVKLNNGEYTFVYRNPNDMSCASILSVCCGCQEDCRRI